MAINSRFKIRRSTTYNGTVAAIPAAVAELVHITTNANNYVTRVGHKLYVGVGTEVGGQASDFEAIGGQYYTQLLDGVAGVLNPSAAIITDANSRISGLNIASAGTLTLNNTANTFSTTIKAAPGLSANYALTLPTVVGVAGQALVTDGTGVLSWGAPANNSNTTIPLNTASAYLLADTSANQYFKIDTTTGANVITIGNSISTGIRVVKPNTVAAYSITDGTNSYFNISTSTATPTVNIGFGGVVNVNNLTTTGGTIATTATTANIVNTVATTVNLAGAATAVNIGAATGTTTVNNNLVVTGNLTINGATQTLNAVNLSVQDSIIQQGLVNGVAPTSATTFDLGSKYSYYDTTAKNSAIFWQRSTSRFVLADVVTESASVLTVATPTITTTDYSDLVLGGLYINDQAATTLGVAEPVIAYQTINGVTARYLSNIVLDGGVF